MSFIEVKDLCKDYKIAKSGKGIGGAIKSLFHREYAVKEAVKNVSFSIDKSEVVGYIDPQRSLEIHHTETALWSVYFHQRYSDRRWHCPL